jgi:hypothetical protein
MDKLVIDLQHCYGIKQLQTEFDFAEHASFAIYAANGAMKSSLAKTFRDFTQGTQSGDRVFEDRPCHRLITDETGSPVNTDEIVVIAPYDEEFGTNDKTCTLLVNNRLRRDYEALLSDIEKAKTQFLKALKKQSQSRKNIETEISLAFTRRHDQFFKALIRIKNEVDEWEEAGLAAVDYDVIFDDKVMELLRDDEFRRSLEEYIEKYNELLSGSTYFKKGVFNYYNGGQIAKTLAANGFFKAKHAVRLNGDKPREVFSEEELTKIIDDERETILSDAALKARFTKIEQQISRHANLREFHEYLLHNEFIVPKLANLDHFKEHVWLSYIKQNHAAYKELLEKFQTTEARLREIEAQAANERTTWEGVIDIFNERFFVPFKVQAKNRVPLILGVDTVLNLEFSFEDGEHNTSLARNELLSVLSTGERKALYILNIIFEVEARRKSQQQTCFIVDDIADSFDYRNKYAILEYLRDVHEEDIFKQIILTHNFDFFRAVSKFIGYGACRMALKTDTAVTLVQASGIENIFVKDWKRAFFTDAKKKIASIPFMRNLIEYTKGKRDADYVLLTSLLHFKDETSSLTIKDVDDVFYRVFGGTPAVGGPPLEPAYDYIVETARSCLSAPAGLNFENKIVMSIAIRLLADKYLKYRIADRAFFASIKGNQTSALYRRFRDTHSSEIGVLSTMHKVILMTPDGIHLNSFMYEPIMDMSDEHLRYLLRELLALDAQVSVLV